MWIAVPQRSGRKSRIDVPSLSLADAEKKKVDFLLLEIALSISPSMLSTLLASGISNFVLAATGSVMSGLAWEISVCTVLLVLCPQPLPDSLRHEVFRAS